MKNSLIKVLSFVMALTMIVGCFSAIPFSAADDDCDHKNSEVVRKEDATCAKGGYTVYKCKDCGETYFGDYTPISKEHTALKELPASNATCNYPAMTAGIYCADCMVDEEGNIDWTKAEDDDALKAPEAVEDSVKLGHKFIPVHVASNDCTVATYDWYKCERCGLNPEEVLAEHRLNTTLTLEEVQEITAKYVPKKNMTEAGSHTFEDVEIVTPAGTCKDGLAKATCTECGKSLEIVIPCTHNYVVVTGTQGSCDAVVSGEQCTICKTYKPGTVFNTNVQHQFTSQVSVINDTVLAMGYTTIASLGTPATCTTDGHQLYKCVNCDAYQDKTLPATGHNIGWTLVNDRTPVTDEDKAAYCQLAVKKVGTCRNANCDLDPVEEILIPAVRHTMETVNNAEDIECGVQLQTWTECKTCDYDTKDAVVFGATKGHTFGAWSEAKGEHNVATTKGDKTYGIYRERKCADCDAVEYESLVAYSANAHAANNNGETAGSTMSYGSDVKTVAATCAAPAYQAYYCKTAGCNHVGAAIEGTQGEAKDPNNHVNGEAKLIQTTKEPTCTATGSKIVQCTCGAVKTVTIAALEHEEAEGIQLWVKGTVIKDFNPEDPSYTLRDVREIAGTCVRVGQTKGKVCTRCGVITKAPVPTTKGDVSKAATHVNKTELGKGTATCIAGAYTKYYCKDCKQEVTIYTSAPAADFHDSGLTYVPYTAPTCGKAGNYAYNKCDVCKLTIEVVACTECGNGHTAVAAHTTGVDFDTAVELNDPVIPALAHELADVPEDPETCTAPGTTAHKACKHCEYTEGKRVIPAHGTKYLVPFVAKTATCTEEGLALREGATLINGAFYCSKCDENGEIAVTKVVPATDHTYRNAGHSIINGKGDTFATATPIDCTLPIVQVENCTVCFALVIKNVKPGYTAHNYELTTHKYTVNEAGQILLDGVVQSGLFNCEQGTYEFKGCVRCDAEQKTNEKPAIPHYFMDGTTKVEIDLDCKNIANFEGEQCALCGGVVDSDAEAATGLLTTTHNFIMDSKDPTCTEVGYNLKVCLDCGFEAYRQEIPALGGHEPSEDALRSGYLKDNVIEIVEATNVADGYILYRCPVCKEEVKFVLKALEDITFTVDAVSGFSGGQVAVTIYASAKDYKFNTMKLMVYHTAGIVLSADKKATLDYAFPTEDNVTLRVTKNNSIALSEYKTAGIVIYAPNNAEGEAVDTTINGDKVALCTLYFDVLPYTLMASVEVEVEEIKNAEGDDLTDDADVDFAEKDEEWELISPVGDTNGDGMLDATDSVQIQKSIYTGEYNAALDFNADGKINLDDHVAFLKFYASEQTMLDYFEMVGVDYMTFVNAYDLRVDLDGDKTITDNDFARIGEALEIVLSTEEGAMYVNFLGMDGVIYIITQDILENGIFTGEAFDEIH